MRGRANVHRAPTWTAYLALLAQINLLWVSVLHRHDEEPIPPRATAVEGGNWASRPVLQTGLLCTACQIVRNSAARPTLATPAPHPAAYSPMGHKIDPSESPFHARYVAYGRAPPVG